MPTFRIPEIHCDGCIRALAAAANRVDSGAVLRADLATKAVTVETALPDAEILQAFEDAGFAVDRG